MSYLAIKYTTIIKLGKKDGFQSFIITFSFAIAGETSIWKQWTRLKDLLIINTWESFISVHESPLNQ